MLHLNAPSRTHTLGLPRDNATRFICVHLHYTQLCRKFIRENNKEVEAPRNCKNIYDMIIEYYDFSINIMDWRMKSNCMYYYT